MYIIKYINRSHINSSNSGDLFEAVILLLDKSKSVAKLLLVK